MATKNMTSDKFIKSSKKILSSTPIDLQAATSFIRDNISFIRSYPFGDEILDKDISYIDILRQLRIAFINNVVEVESVEGEEKAAKKSQEKELLGVECKIVEQVFDSKLRDFIDDWKIVVVIDSFGKEVELVKSFKTEEEARRWASNKLFNLQPANRHKAIITDSRFANVMRYEMDSYHGDSRKTVKLGHSQVCKTNKTNAPLKQKMKAKGDVFKFSNG